MVGTAFAVRGVPTAASARATRAVMITGNADGTVSFSDTAGDPHVTEHQTVPEDVL